jgi:hypothetical protein
MFGSTAGYTLVIAKYLIHNIQAYTQIKANHLRGDDDVPASVKAEAADWNPPNSTSSVPVPVMSLALTPALLYGLWASSILCGSISMVVGGRTNVPHLPRNNTQTSQTLAHGTQQ